MTQYISPCHKFRFLKLCMKFYHAGLFCQRLREKVKTSRHRKLKNVTTTLLQYHSVLKTFEVRLFQINVRAGEYACKRNACCVQASGTIRIERIKLRI